MTYQYVNNWEVIFIWEEAYCIIYQHHYCETKMETWGGVVIPCIVVEAVVWLIWLPFLGSRRSTSVRRLTIMSGMAKEFLSVRFNSETSSELELLIWARSDPLVSEITLVSEVSYVDNPVGCGLLKTPKHDSINMAKAIITANILNIKFCSHVTTLVTILQLQYKSNVMQFIRMFSSALASHTNTQRVILDV